MKHAVQLFSLHTLDGKEGSLFAKSFVICGCYDDGLWPDDYSPTRPISIKWSRCEKSKGCLISRSTPDQLRRAICRRGSVPDCDLLMVWRLFAWICLMADFSRGPSAGRGDMGLARTCTLAVQPHLNPSPPFSSPLATLLISPTLNLPSSTLFWRQVSHEQNRTTQGFDIPVVACSHLSSDKSDQHTWEKMQ